LKLHQNRARITGTLHEDQYTIMIITRSVLLRMRKISNKICRENQHTHFVFNNFFFKWYRIGDNVNDNMVHAQCLLGTYGYKYTLGICNTYCFSTASMITRKRPNALPVFFSVSVLRCCSTKSQISELPQFGGLRSFLSRLTCLSKCMQHIMPNSSLVLNKEFKL
jgi:hypothetical protein